MGRHGNEHFIQGWIDGVARCLSNMRPLNYLRGWLERPWNDRRKKKEMHKDDTHCEEFLSLGHPVAFVSLRFSSPPHWPIPRLTTLTIPSPTSNPYPTMPSSERKRERSITRPFENTHPIIDSLWIANELFVLTVFADVAKRILMRLLVSVT